MFIAGAAIHEMTGVIIIVTFVILNIFTLKPSPDTQSHVTVINDKTNRIETNTGNISHATGNNTLQSCQDNTFDYENINLNLTRIPNALDIQGMDGDILGIETFDIR